MSKVITETATYAAAVTVPEGTDSRNLAAEAVEAIAQVLADRTKFLKVVTDVAARTNVTNNFGPLQNFGANVAVTGNVSCSDLNAGDDVNAVDNVTAGNDVTATRDITATRDLTAGRRVLATQGMYLPGDQRIEYVGGPGPTPSLRTRVLPLQWGEAASIILNDPAFTGFGWIAPGPSATSKIAFPLWLPHGATLVGFTFNHTNVTVANSFTFWRRDVPFAGPGTETDTPINSATGVTAPAEVNTPLDAMATVVTNVAAEYSLIVTLASGNTLHGIQYQFLDPGPRNE